MLLVVSDGIGYGGLSIRVRKHNMVQSLMDSPKRKNHSSFPFNELSTSAGNSGRTGRPIVSIASSGFNEVQKYIVLDGHTYGAEALS